MSAAPERCPNCGGQFPFRYGPHPTWIPCAPPVAEECRDTDGDGNCPICIGGRWRCPKK